MISDYKLDKCSRVHYIIYLSVWMIVLIIRISIIPIGERERLDLELSLVLLDI